VVNTVTPSGRPFVIASIVLATFMAAIEGTIVATAMPSIVGQLGGFAYYSWVFSAFLLAQSATTVIYGKLADLLGRKPVLIAGVVLLLIGSLLCGFAWSMGSLIAFRMVQGFGAGAITPITMTVIGDLYKLEERGRTVGMMAAVWALSGVLGPLAGAFIVANLSWAWIFWINLPIGALAIVGFALFLHEAVERHRARIDYIGALLFCISIGSLLILMTETNAGPETLGALGFVSLATGVIFLRHERRTQEPIISIELWARPLVATSNVATLLAGMIMIALMTVLPIYVQGAMGRSPVVAGSSLSALVIGWPLAVMLSGRLYRVLGVRRTLRTGSVLFPLGASVLLLLTPQSPPLLVGISTFLLGFGMGLLSMTTVALVQDSVEWSMRGSATASLLFARSLGTTIGATAVGGLLNIGIAHYGSATLAASVHRMLNQPDGLAQLSNHTTARFVFDEALRWSLSGIVMLALLTFIAVWLIPVTRRPIKNEQAQVGVSRAASH